MSKNIALFSDLHLPVQHPQALEFCVELVETFDCGEIYQVGDALDICAWSTYLKDPDCPSATAEAEKAMHEMKLWEQYFPRMKLVWGNHERRIGKALNTAGFGEALVDREKFMHTFMGLPKGWTYSNRYMLNTSRGDIAVIHGDEGGITQSFGSAVREMGCSVVHGHRHTQYGITYHANPNSLMFHMNIGSLIDKKNPAFRYDKGNLKRPILGASVLLDGVPMLVPMHLNRGGEWTGKILG